MVILCAVSLATEDVSWRHFTSHPRGFLSSNQREGSCGLLNSVWECPYRVVKDTCELWFSESFGQLVGRWPNCLSCGLLGLGEPSCEWLLSCMRRLGHFGFMCHWTTFIRISGGPPLTLYSGFNVTSLLYTHHTHTYKHRHTCKPQHRLGSRWPSRLLGYLLVCAAVCNPSRPWSSAPPGPGQ